MYLQATGLLINLQTVQRLNITVLSAVNSTVSDSYSGLNALLKYEVAIFVYLSFKYLNDRGFFSIYYFYQSDSLSYLTRYTLIKRNLVSTDI